ncbi:hypothetical protein BDC45DRAFT_266645 [Circinella umbellata]|nr:hypothetical protein BDC45DRAFT_266645 [Circinella umbellata]
MLFICLLQYLLTITTHFLDSESQLKEFIDNVFLIVDPRNERVYERTELSSEQIFQLTKQYTSIFQKGQLGTFTSFAKKIKARFLKASVSRKRTSEGRIERKILYVMKPDDRAQNINSYQSRYQEFIKNLKADGYDIIGYARKSPTKLSNDALEAIIKK